MTSRERVLAAMRREVPDRVPFDIGGFTPGFEKKYREKYGDKDPYDYFENDVAGVWFNGPKKIPDYRKYYEGSDIKYEHVNSIGVAHIPGSIEHFTHMVAPLRNAERIEQLVAYELPDYTQPECWSGIKDYVARLQKKGIASCAGMACTLFEWSWQIRGMEEFLSDLSTQLDWAEVLVDKWFNIRIFMIKKFAEAGCDIIQMGDDVSMQTGMMMSPEIWRKVFKPRMAKLIMAAKDIKNDILIWYHSDGKPEKIIPDLIDIGLDILNPIQPECMDPAEIKKLYGNRLSLWGAIGTQSTMPFGNADEVRRVVKERIKTCGKGGGLLLAPTHVLEPEVPLENLEAFVEAVKKYGKY
jgi:uroporphyrinogen decarboxylase